MMLTYNIPDADGYLSHTIEYADQAAVDRIGLPPGATLEALPARPVSLADAKAAKLLKIEQERDAAETASVNVHGRQWQADEKSQKLLSGAIQLHGLTGYLPAHWRDESNNNMPLSTVGELVAIATAIVQQIDSAYTTSWTRKAALNEAQTLAEVEAI